MSPRKILLTTLLLLLAVITGACQSQPPATPVQTIIPTSINQSTPAQLPPVFSGDANVNVLRMISGFPKNFGGSGPMHTVNFTEELRLALNNQGFAPINNSRDVLSAYKEEGGLRVYVFNLPSELPSGGGERLASALGLVTFGNLQNDTPQTLAIAAISLRNRPPVEHIIAGVCIDPPSGAASIFTCKLGEIYLLVIDQSGRVLAYLPALYPAGQPLEMFWNVKGIIVKQSGQELAFRELSQTAQPASTQSPASGNKLLTILYTDDEHGWMAGDEKGSGAAEMVGLWRTLEGYGSNENVLVLSGGDNWTGPAISTWFDGQGMVEVMNALDYDASTIGNHEFDFGLDALKARIAEAGFPYLSANLRDKSTGEIPTDLGIQPYALLDVGGISVGVIGLTTLSTPLTTNPVNLERFEFVDYKTALRQYIPEMRSAGAQIILVSAHACPEEMGLLARKVQDLQISFIGGGHCHSPSISQIGDTVVAVGGANLVGYAYVYLAYDPGTGLATVQDYGLRKNKGGDPEPEIAAIIQSWQAKTDAELNKEIGYLRNEITQGSPEMQALITGSWLAEVPTADIAITNLGGLRDRLPAGSLTLAHIVGMLPFDNYLVEVKLTGKQIDKVLQQAGRQPAIGGMHRQAFRWILDKTGQALQPDQTYSVLVNDFMYAGGDDYGLLAQYDPKAYNTGIDWRQPVIDWIIDQKTSPTHPLDPLIQALLP